MTDVSARSRDQGRFAPEHHPVSAVTLTVAPAPAASPASVLADAVGSGKTPDSIPWPEPPASDGYVEVNISDDDARDVLDRCGHDGDAVDNYQQVYAGICLAAANDADFYGVKADGSSEIIALGISDYEQAINPFEHAHLSYRDGYTNPMPPYVAAQEDVRARRLEAASGLLEEAGVSLELEDLDRHQFWLKTDGAQQLQLRVATFQAPKLVETRNWRAADDTHLAEFLGDGYTPEAGKLLTDCAALIARDTVSKEYRKVFATKA